MKITTKQIKTLIKEEIRKLLSEGSRMIMSFEDYGDGIYMPFTKDGEMLKTHTTSMAELIDTHFMPELLEALERVEEKPEEAKKELDKMRNNDLQDMLNETSLIGFASFVELMRALVPSFDVIRGNLQVADVGYTDIAVKLSVDGRSLVIDEENDKAEYDQDGDVEVFFGYTVTSEDLGPLLEREAERHENDYDYRGVYLAAYEEGETDYDGRDEPTTGVLRINKVMEDINNGTLTVRFELSDPPLFVVERNRDL